LETGADVFEIAAEPWSKSWPCQPSAPDLQGVGATHDPLQSAQQIHWRDEEGHPGLFISYVLDNLPVNLWGSYTCTLNNVVFHQMFQQGYNPLRGLRRYQQGSYILYNL
jgi:hypothetical protein